MHVLFNINIMWLRPFGRNMVNFRLIMFLVLGEILRKCEMQNEILVDTALKV